jgi:ABC-type branched-subunit amino acid transport system substrate-binding protein
MRSLKRLALVAIMTITMLGVTLANATSPRQGTTQIKIGIIGAPDGSTAQGVTLAVERVNAKGPFTVAGSTGNQLDVVAVPATNPDEVKGAIDKLKGSGVVAIFGPDDDTLAVKSADTLNASGLPVFTGTGTLDFKPGGLVFRTRANYTWQFGALANVLTTDLARKSIAIFQGGADYESRAGIFAKSLQASNVTPVITLAAPPDATASDMAKALMDKTPDAIVAFGAVDQIANLYRTLRGSGYQGQFVTQYADQSTFIRTLPPDLRAELYGVTTWPYSWNTPDSNQFTHDYTAIFGVAPDSYSAAAYDSAIALIIAIQKNGTTPTAIQSGILALPKADSITGIFNPSIGGNELSQNVAIVRTGPYGAPILIARYNAAEKQALSEVPPTSTPKPSLTPTGTPAGNVLVAKGTINVRSGPGTNYPVIGKLKKGDQLKIIGANSDLSWLVVDYRQQQGWVANLPDGIDVFGDPKAFPIVAPPPSPTPQPSPTITLTPTAQPKADLQMVGTPVMSPAVPGPGQAFTVTVVIKNAGGADAGQFAVATTFEPGNVFAAFTVDHLAAGQQTTVVLSGSIPATTISTVAIVIDLNNQVDEGPDGKNNNKPTFTYRIDKPYVAQSNTTLTSGSTVDLYGGTADINWDGTKLVPKNGAKLGVLTGVQMTGVYWDLLSPDKINNTAGIASSELVQGLVIGIYTAEGNRGAIQINGNSGGNLTVTYNVYAN